MDFGFFLAALDRLATKKRVHALCLCLLAAAILSFGALNYLDSSYVAEKPTRPDPDAGRVYKMKLQHGYEIYVTLGEYRFHRLATTLGMSLFITLFIVAALLRRRYFADELAEDERYKKSLELKEKWQRAPGRDKRL